MATVKCPSCVRPLEVEDAYRDWTVRCPHCGHEFVPADAGAPARPPEDDRPRRRRRDEDDEDDRDDDPDDRDGPGRVPARVREEALRVVAAPATWLEICGWLTALGSAGLALLFAALAAGAANNPQPNGKQDEDLFALMFVGCCAGALGMPYGLAMAVGARKLRHLSSRPWAMTGAILGVAGFSLFGVCGLVQAGFGAWALVALDNPAVREAFGLPPRHGRRRRRRREWDD